MTPLLTGTDGSVRRAGATQRPPLYDGSTSWDAYITQFKMLAQLNHWTEVEKATRSGITGFVKPTCGSSKQLQGTGDSPRESFWDGAPSRAPQNEAQKPKTR